MAPGSRTARIVTGEDTRAPDAAPAIVCVGSGEYVPWGWRWRKCPECGAAVWRDPATLGLVVHSPGDRGQDPENENGVAQD